MSNPYMDATLPAHMRAKDLASRMTLEQKVRQLTCLIVGETVDEDTLRGGIGGVTVYADFPTMAQRKAFHDELQKKIMDKSGFGIPALFHAEGICGAIAAGYTVFPAPIAVGASFDPKLSEDIGKCVRGQMLALGIRQALAPVLDLARDFRWGRTNECYGSDPTLVLEMGCAYINGLQGKTLAEGVAATAKHFLGHSIGEGGLNLARCQTDSRDLRENFARPFEAAARDCGLACVMNSYAEINGKPVIASKAILTDLLRRDLGFQGLTVSDYMSIDTLEHVYGMANDRAQAGIMALEAGLDMELPRPYGFSPELREAVKKGLVSEKTVDRALRSVLKLKFELGLFENPFAAAADTDAGHDDAVSKRAAEHSLVLLKNEGILPVKDHAVSVAVIGPTGDSVRLLNGTYTRPATLRMAMEMGGGMAASVHGMESLVDTFDTVADGAASAMDAMVEEAARAMCPGSGSIAQEAGKLFANAVYRQGCSIGGSDRSGLGDAVDAAKAADFVILTVGGKNGWDAGSTSGEGFDSADIGLPGIQEELALAVLRANPNTVVVHTDGRPLVSPGLYAAAPAVLEAWLPGPLGGKAIVEAIAGITNPGGRLPADVPRSAGQSPLYYYSHRPARGADRHGMNPGGYADVPAGPQYPFGYGLTYTSFAYGNAGLTDCVGKDGVPTLSITAEVENTGNRAGDEVVQLYGRDQTASIVRPDRELIGFARVSLEPGQKKVITFTFRLDRFAFASETGDWVLEEGTFRFFIGPNSARAERYLDFNLDQTLPVDHRKRGFSSRVHIG